MCSFLFETGLGKRNPQRDKYRLADLEKGDKQVASRATEEEGIQEVMAQDTF